MNTMKKIKRFAIWLALVIVIAVLTEAAGLAVVNLVGGPTLLDPLRNWAKNAEKLTTPVLVEKTEENNYSNGLEDLYVRPILSNLRFNTSEETDTKFTELFFGNIDVDQSLIFYNKDGMNPLSTGIFLSAYQLPEGDENKIKNTLGVIDVNKFIQNDCAKDILEILENTDEEPTVQINAYSIDENYFITPAEITLSDKNGNVLGKFECSADGTIVKNDRTFVHSKTFVHNDTDLLNKLKTAYLGERQVDKLAAKAASEHDFSNGDTHREIKKPGLGNLTMIYSENSGDWGEVAVLRFSFVKSFFIYFSALNAVMTIIFLIVCAARDKKRAS
jgi:hypothetical protein